MRILLAAHQSRSLNGIGNYARGLSEWLPHAIAADHQLDVVDGVALADRADPPNVRRIARSPPMRSGRDRLRHEQIVLPGLAREADLLHLCDFRPTLATRAPFMITIHDVVFLDHPEWMPPGVARYKRLNLAAVLALRPAGIVCDSRFSAARLLHHHPEASRLPVTVVYPGVRREPAPAFAPTGGPPYVLTVSDVEPRKGHLNLLAALRQAWKAGSELRWKVVGMVGHDGEAIASQLRDEPRVDLCGRVSDEDLETHFAGALAVAVPSLYEGFGLPAVEAMARGIPLLASTGSSLDEVVGDGGWAMPADATEAWADALLTLERDAGARADLVARGTARVERFDYARCAAEIAAFYPDLRLRRGLLRRSPGRAASLG